MGERIQRMTVKGIVERMVRAVVLDVYDRPAHDLEELTDKLTDRVFSELRDSGALVQSGRTATVSSGVMLATVQDYLPHCYKARALKDTRIVIEGYDDHGWTLEGYVIPRLASALIVAKEVT